MNMSEQKGFTLIELVVVIVILGILAATALPRFMDMRTDAQAAAIQGVAGAVNSAFAVNYGARQVAGSSSNGAVQVSGTIAATNLNTLAAAIMAGGMPANYTVTAGAAVTCGTSNGTTATIAVSNSTFTNNTSAAATLICTG